MSTLNCRLGDLAVTVRAALPENLGNLVWVIGLHGVDDWWGFDAPTHLWEVQAIEGAYLTYEFGDGSRVYRETGLLPDSFLKPIAPKAVSETDKEALHAAL